MSIDTVLRIKRKRTDDPLRILFTSDDLEVSAKKRRVWQLSRSSDSRGIPVPISTSVNVSCDKLDPTARMAPPRFSVRKRKASDALESRKSVLDLEREERSTASEAGDASSELSAENEALRSMLADYLSSNGISQRTGIDGDEDYVYDIYYPQAATQAIDAATEALTSNYGLLEHFDWENVEALVTDDAESDSDGHDSEDSNAEDWIGNDYPDEEGEYTSDDLDIQNSDCESFREDRDEWK